MIYDMDKAHCLHLAEKCIWRFGRAAVTGSPADGLWCNEGIEVYSNESILLIPLSLV